MRVDIELADLLRAAEEQAWSYEELAKSNRDRAAGQQALAAALRAAIAHSYDQALTLATAKLIAAIVAPYSSIANESAGQLAARLLAVLPPAAPPPRKARACQG